MADDITKPWDGTRLVDQEVQVPPSYPIGQAPSADMKVGPATHPAMNPPGELPRWNIEVELTGTDGNAFMLLGLMRKELRRAGADKQELALFTQEATGGDYDDLLATCMSWVHVV